jgi:hypothetical protein
MNKFLDDRKCHCFIKLNVSSLASYRYWLFSLVDVQNNEVNNGVIEMSKHTKGEKNEACSRIQASKHAPQSL